jgi:hypothetical protein
MKYQIEFTKEQLSVVQQACEFMSRFCTGQLDMLPQSFQDYLRQEKESVDDYCQRRDLWLHWLKIAKQAMFPELSTNASYGIDSKYEEANICYDIYRPILEQFTKEYKDSCHDKMNSTWSVYDSPGLTTSKEGRISIKTIDNG